jgi:prevent-host-death family protein
VTAASLSARAGTVNDGGGHVAAHPRLDGSWSRRVELEGLMKTLPLAQVKMNLSRLVDQVLETDEEIMITRNGRPAAVLVSPDEYEGWKETQAIRSDPELMAEIRRGLRMLKRGGKIYTLEELLPQD